MQLTQHAQVRMQQRGIRNADLVSLFKYGRVEYDHHGSRVLFLDHSARRRIALQQGVAEARRLGSIYAVVATDGAVVTVGHRDRRIWRR